MNEWIKIKMNNWLNHDVLSISNQCKMMFSLYGLVQLWSNEGLIFNFSTIVMSF